MKRLRFVLWTIFATFWSMHAVAQSLEVTGKVTDATGTPLQGATVRVKGGSAATTTSETGNFTLSVPQAGATLQISYVGMQELELRVQDATPLSITLQMAGSEMTDVVVVGYGTQRKRAVTGAISSIKAEDINQIPATSVNEMLRGQAAGVQVRVGSARPGGSSSIQIRGRRSLSAGNDPLFILDGVPVENIDDINIADVESVEVLKDANATAIYGARAANGVIIVTTKRGKAGKLQVDVSTYMAVQQVTRNFDFYNPEEWAQLRREAFRQGTITATDPVGVFLPDDVVFPLALGDALRANQSVNWEDLMLRDALLQKHDVSVRMGTDKTRFAGSIGTFNQQGMARNSGFERHNLRLNIDQKLSNKISLGANVSYQESNRAQEDGSFTQYITLPPYTTPFDDQGNINMIVGTATQFNPLWNEREAYNRTRFRSSMFNLFGEWRIWGNLRYKVNASMNAQNSTQKQFRSSIHTSAMGFGGDGSIIQREYKDYLIENMLMYDHTIGKAGKMDYLLMHSGNEITNSFSQLSAQGFPNDILGVDGIRAATNILQPNYTVSERRLESYMARIRYNHNEKYFFNFTMRADGSSVFGANNKWGYFPSAGASWLLSEEAFIKKSNTISNLKLRASYGAVGNQAISPYQTLGVVNSSLFLFGTNPQPVTGYLPGSELYNPNLKWETSLSTNIGLDFGLWKDRVTGSVEYYDTRTRDLLIRRQINPILGYTNMLVNLGEVQNTGIEATLHFEPIKRKDFFWGVDFIYTRNRNKILKIDGRVDENGKPVDDLVNNWFIGRSANVYFTWQPDGIWQSKDQITGSHMPGAQPGDVNIRDINGDGQINGDDRVILDRDPRFIYTLRNTFKYKGFDLMAEIYSVVGGVLYNPYLIEFNQGGSLNGALNGVKVDYWTPERGGNSFPRPYQVGNAPFMSSLAYQNAGFFRLRNLTLGYTFPKAMLEKTRVKNLRAYVNLYNWITITDFLSYSPEVNPGAYPEPRMIQGGINVSF